MADQLITMTRREKWRLEAKAKSGWKAFYQHRYEVEEMGVLRRELEGMVTEVRRGNEVDVTHLKQMFLQLYDRLGDLTDCPVCYEPMVKDNTFVPNCGHLLCKTCRPRIPENKCPECRRDLGRQEVVPVVPVAPVDDDDIPLARLRRGM
jgi:hypothetical protein